MSHFDINDENYAGDCRRGSTASLTQRAQTLPNGDIEIVNTNRNGDAKLLVVPKNKRAALAQFLIEAQ